MPNEQQIRQIVQQEISSYASRSRFNVQGIPQHIHNGVDAPITFQPVLTYIGLLSADEIGILPTGWTAVKNGTGDFTIIHNLDTFAYAVVASPTGLTGDVDITTDNNNAELSWFAAGTNTPQDTPFYFILTTIANKKTSLPTYQSTNYLQTGQLQ